MAQNITLEEAAAKLGITPAEMKKRLKTDPEFQRLSQIRDGSTIRFKLAAIEELARQLGMASEDGLQLAPTGDELGSDDFKVPGIGGKKKPAGDDAPLDLGDGSGSDEVFSLTEEPPKPAPKSGKLAPSKGDSDVRLDGGKTKSKSSPDENVQTEELALDLSGPGSAVIKGGSSAKLSAPKSPSSGKLSLGGSSASTRPPDSSEFELSLDADSDDFDLQMNNDGGDEVDIGTLPKDKSAKASKSGINLNDPADSGISLEKGKKTDKKKDDKKKDDKKKQDDSEGSDVDFELSLDSSAVASGTKLGAPKSGKLVLDSDSDSEFELTLDDSGGSSLEQAALGESDVKNKDDDKGDIFETDFEIPPMTDESGSEAVAVESDTDLDKADFELESDSSEESGSEVVVLEDEETAPKAKKGGAKAKPKKLVAEEADVDLEDEEDEGSAAGALKGAKGKKRDADDDEDEAATSPAGTVDRPTKPWGVVPVLFLFPTFAFVLIGAIMGYELLNTMWGYQQPKKPTAPLTTAIAGVFGMELKDQ
jgi:hypothetical protein